ncbi:MAG: calcium/sodium antiporter [Phycisphaerales bacterium]
MPDLLIDILALAGGIALLLVGGDVLVRGAVALAARLGVAPLLVGMTVVAFGTSAPELAFNIAAALKGSSGLSFGNVVGSNIANIGLILGLSALFKPLLVHASVIKRELPVMCAITLLTAALLMLPWPERGLLGGGEGLSRLDAVLLLAGFLVFLVMTLRAAIKGDADAGFAKEVKETVQGEGAKVMPLWRAGLFILLGLAGLVGGGQLAEIGATGIARSMGWTDEFIGLTVVAIATSLPELATSLIAVRKGHVDIAVGNVVGSNVFNLGLVFGVTGLVAPISLPALGAESIIVMLVLSFLLIPFSRTAGRTLSRAEGGVLLLCYAGVMGYQVWHALNPS